MQYLGLSRVGEVLENARESGGPPHLVDVVVDHHTGDLLLLAAHQDIGHYEGVPSVTLGGGLEEDRSPC